MTVEGLVVIIFPAEIVAAEEKKDMQDLTNCVRALSVCCKWHTIYKSDWFIAIFVLASID